MAMEARRKAAQGWKWCWVALICLIPAGTSFGQESPGAAALSVEILKLHWEKQVRLPRNFDPSVIPTNGSFVDPASRSSGIPVTSGATDTARTANNVRTTSPNSPPPEVAFPASPGRLPVFYVYSMKIKNVGSKLIEGMAWDYLFIDPGNNAELGKHEFLSHAKVPTDKSATLRVALRSPPTRVVRSSESTKNAHPKLIEKSVIQCVLYADDTVWKNPHARDGVCDLLKNNKALIKRKTG
jgi:hypothetical protein